MQEKILFFCGIYSLGFAIFHLGFWKLFHWNTELAKTTLPIRAVIQIANLRLIYLFLFVAVLCFFYTNELLTTSLGHAILIGMSLFWTGRTIEQFIFLPYNRPMIHLLTIIFIIGSIIFILPVLPWW